jgi:hypothetical protein
MLISYENWNDDFPTSAKDERVPHGPVNALDVYHSLLAGGQSDEAQIMRLADMAAAEIRQGRFQDHGALRSPAVAV